MDDRKPSLEKLTVTFHLSDGDHLTNMRKRNEQQDRDGEAERYGAVFYPSLIAQRFNSIWGKF